MQNCFTHNKQLHVQGNSKSRSDFFRTYVEGRVQPKRPMLGALPVHCCITGKLWDNIFPIFPNVSAEALFSY